MLTIRLSRKGKKNQPFFRVVLVDKRRSSTGGRSVEDLGYVDPLKKRRSLNGERIKYWLSKGAKASVTIHNLLVTEKVIDEPKIKVSNISKKKQAEIIKTKADAEIAKRAEVEKPAEPAPAIETPKEEFQPSPEDSAGEAKPEPAENSTDNQAGESADSKPAEETKAE
jgi:small subunit ribosomal protein S16